MTIKPCEFINGTCTHCKAPEQGECEGWVPSDREQFMDEIASLTIANKDLQDWFDAIKADHNALKDAARFALDALEYHTAQTRPIERTQIAIEILKAVL